MHNILQENAFLQLRFSCLLVILSTTANMCLPPASNHSWEVTRLQLNEDIWFPDSFQSKGIPFVFQCDKWKNLETENDQRYLDMHQCMCPVLSSLASFASEKGPYRLELPRGIEETPIHKCFNIQEIKFVLTIISFFFQKPTCLLRNMLHWCPTLIFYYEFLLLMQILFFFTPSIDYCHWE